MSLFPILKKQEYYVFLDIFLKKKEKKRHAIDWKEIFATDTTKDLCTEFVKNFKK